MPGVPLLPNLAKDEQSRQVMELIASYTAFGIAYALPPEVPAERVALLRKSFDATMKDPAFLAEMAKAKLDVKPASGETLQALASKFSDVSPELIERTKTALEW